MAPIPATPSARVLDLVRRAHAAIATEPERARELLAEAMGAAALLDAGGMRCAGRRQGAGEGTEAIAGRLVRLRPRMLRSRARRRRSRLAELRAPA